MKHYKKTIIITAIVLIFFLSLIQIGIATYFYRLALNPKADKSKVLDAPHNELSPDGQHEMASKPSDSWFETSGYEEHYIQSYDNLKLHSYLVRQKQPSSKWVILVHGYTGNALQMTNRAKWFYDHGYHTMIIDCRGHGKSEGTYIGMGWHDRLDIVNWIQSIVHMDSNAQIALYGISMGGAAVMMTSGEELPANVKVIVEDCGYTSVDQEFAYQLKETFHLPSFPIINTANLITRIRAGYTLKNANALKQVAKSKTPMLFIHGDDDTFVPSHMLEQVYEAADVEKEKLIIKGAGHGAASHVDNERYWNTIEQFINKYIV